MTLSGRISRRTALRGLGTAVALPFLECMLPARASAATAAGKPPVRMAFVYVPNGVNMAEWTPRGEGADFKLPSILEPLQPFQKDLTVLTGLALDAAWAHGDGGGDHARAMASFLTGIHPRKTAGSDIRAGVSVDQVAAQKVGHRTKFASLEIGCERGLQAGACDTGYSCAYSGNISWKGESLPMAKETDPRLVFERLFAGPVKGEADEARARRDRYKKSVLDFVSEDAAVLRSRVGGNDRRKLDEYLDGVRELEVRVERAGRGPEQAPPGAVKPAGIPKDYAEHIRLLGDLLVLAFQGDLTRIGTFVFANEGSNRSYRPIGIPEGHHELSHHGNDPVKLEKIRQINHFHMTQFAYLLERLKKTREGDGTLLDQCMVVYGSGNSDGNRHNHDDLPVLLAGKGGGTIPAGRHLRFPRDKATPVCDLYVSLLERMGAPVERFGDSKGPLALS
jgi:hypothetical protein